MTALMANSTIRSFPKNIIKIQNIADAQIKKTNYAKTNPSIAKHSNDNITNQNPQPHSMSQVQSKPKSITNIKSNNNDNSVSLRKNIFLKTLENLNSFNEKVFFFRISREKEVHWLQQASLVLLEVLLLLIFSVAIIYGLRLLFQNTYRNDRVFYLENVLKLMNSEIKGETLYEKGSLGMNSEKDIDQKENRKNSRSDKLNPPALTEKRTSEEYSNLKKKDHNKLKFNDMFKDDSLNLGEIKVISKIRCVIDQYLEEINKNIPIRKEYEEDTMSSKEIEIVSQAKAGQSQVHTQKI